MEGDEIARNLGVMPWSLPQALGLDLNDEAVRGALDGTLADLVGSGVLRETQSGNALTLSRVGQAVVDQGEYQLSHVWPVWFRSRQARPGDDDYLAAAVRISEVEHDSFAMCRAVSSQEIFEAIPRPFSPGDATGFFTRHRDQGLIAGVLTGAQTIRPTYKGVVLATQKALSEFQELVAKLEKKWEVASVDFKRELGLATKDQKGEFVKDIISLVNTQQEAQRFLMIGWDPKSREVTGGIGQVTEEQLQQILSSYADPVPTVVLQTGEWHGATVGAIEVIREPAKIPYRFSREIGRFKAGDLFVRHGTVCEPPTPGELQALQEEGDRARRQLGSSS